MNPMNNKDDIKCTRIILVEAERRAEGQAAFFRGRLDLLRSFEKELEGKPDHAINPQILAKWRNEALKPPTSASF